MRMRHHIAPVRALLDPVRVFYSGIDNTIEPVSYIVCFNWWVPERYELWRLKYCRVREVHPSAWVWLLDDFREDTFQTFFLDSRRCRIPFIGKRLMNSIVKFICFANVTSDTEVVISTPNIFVHEWGTYPTMIYSSVSNFTRRAYVTITTQKGLRLWCNYERLRLKRVERKRIALENHVARIRQDIRDDVADK